MPVSTFQLWVLSGCIYFFICGLMSFISNTQSNGQIIFDPIEWLQVGNFGEILFFSSAMGYRLKKVYNEREEAINLVSEEKAIAQQLRFEKSKDIIKTRLEERNRIARDMHDDPVLHSPCRHALVERKLVRCTQRVLDIDIAPNGP